MGKNVYTFGSEFLRLIEQVLGPTFGLRFESQKEPTTFGPSPPSSHQNSCFSLYRPPEAPAILSCDRGKGQTGVPSDLYDTESVPGCDSRFFRSSVSGLSCWSFPPHPPVSGFARLLGSDKTTADVSTTS